MREKEMGKSAPQLEHGYTRIAHGLMEALAAHGMAGRAKSVLLLVLRGTYGKPGSPKVADFRIADMAEALKMDERVLRRELHRLERAKMLVIEKIRAGSGKLVRGTWRLAPQKDPAAWRPWAEVVAEERSARPRERQLSLFQASAEPARTHLGCPLDAPALSGERTLVVPWTHLGCPERSHNVLDQKDLRPQKTEDRKTVRPDVVPPAPAPVTPPAPATPAGSASASSSPTRETTERTLFTPGWWESEHVRRDRERRLRDHLAGLEDWTRETALEVQRVADTWAAGEPGRNPRAYATGIVRNRERLREIASRIEARAGDERERRAREERGQPPEGPPRGGAPRPKAGPPAPAVPPRQGTVQVRGANGCLVERHRPAASLGDVLGDLLAGLGLGRAA